MSTVYGVVKDYDTVRGSGTITLEEPENDVETVMVSKMSIVAETDIEQFLQPKMRVSFLKIEQTPGNWSAFQVRDEEAEPISHTWSKGTIKRYFPQQRDGNIVDMESNESFRFSASVVFGSTKHIWRAQCQYVSYDGNTIAVAGVDGKPFPDDLSKIAKITQERETIAERTPGTTFADEYDVIHEAEGDVDGWPLPKVYKGKVLFYHKHKGFGFITPSNSQNQQDPSNLYFRKEQVIIKANTTEPKIDRGVMVEFQVCRQANGKPCACFITQLGGHPLPSEPVIRYEQPRNDQQILTRQVRQPVNERYVPQERVMKRRAVYDDGLYPKRQYVPRESMRR